MATKGASAWPKCAQSPKSFWIHAVEAYLQRCMQMKTSARASELANELQMTPPTVARHFKRAVGMTLSDYMKQRQLKFAEAVAGHQQGHIGGGAGDGLGHVAHVFPRVSQSDGDDAAPISPQ